MRFIRNKTQGAGRIAACAFLSIAAHFAFGGVAYEAGQWTTFTPVPQADNALYGLTAERTDGIRTTEPWMVKAPNFKNGGFYESQGAITKLTDGSITPVWTNTKDETVRASANRHLIENCAKLTFELTQAKDIFDFRFYTQWDGYRNDVAIDSIEVSADGVSWVRIPGSKFDYGSTESCNTIPPYLARTETKSRYVRMYDDAGAALALDAKYVRISFAEQNVGYGAYWEIEARSGTGGNGIWLVDAEASQCSANLRCAVRPTDADNPGTLVLKIGRSADSLEVYNANLPFNAQATCSECTTEVTGLLFETEYFYAFEYSEGGEVVSAKGGSFTTGREEFPSLPGLWQSRIPGKFNEFGTLFDTNETTVGFARTLGPIMGLTKVSSYGTTIENPLDGSSYAWADNVTYLYKGYVWLEADTTYWFESDQDDAGSIVIDGIRAVRSSNVKSAHGSYDSTYTGWHPVEIRVGNGTGGAGKHGGTGFGWSKTSSGYVTFQDPGDGSVFVCATSVGGAYAGNIYAVNVTDSFLAGDTLYADLDVALNGVYKVYAVTSADYETWTTNTAAIAVSATGLYGAVIPTGTTYVRYLVVLDSDHDACWMSPSVYVPDTFEVTEAPYVVIGQAGVGPASASVPFTVKHPGSGATSWTAKLVWGYETASGFETAAVQGNSDASGELVAEGLMPSRSYVAKLVVVNNLNETTEIPCGFTTSSLCELTGAVHLPGLRQAQGTSSSKQFLNYNLTVDDFAANKQDRTLGMLMAKSEAGGSESTRPTVKDDVSKGWSWSKTNSSYWYEGLVYLEAGRTLYVSSKFDDGVAVYIDDTMVYDEMVQTGDSGYQSPNDYTCGAFVSAYTGWHKFRGYIWDWSGNKGSMHGIAGVQWTTDPAAVAVNEESGVVTAIEARIEDTSLWHEFYDDGTGSFLRLETECGRSIAITSQALGNDGLTAQLAFSAGEAAGTLHVVYGDNYAGEGAWDNDVSLGSIAADATTYGYGPLAGIGTDVKYVRFYLEQTEGKAWSETIVCVDTSVPMFSTGFAVTGLESGDTLVASGALFTVGDDGCAVTVEVSRTGDFTDAVSYFAGSMTEPGTFSATLGGENAEPAKRIIPGEKIYVRAIATPSTPGAIAGSTSVLEVRPAGEPVFKTVEASAKDWTLTVNATLAALGAGTETTVKLYVVSAEGTVTQNVHTATLTSLSDVYSYSGELSAFGTYQWYLTAEGNCPTGDVATEGEPAEIVLFDSANYYWKADVAEGAWSNPANWDREPATERTVFPNGAGCFAHFSRCTGPTTVRLDGKYDLQNLTFDSTDNVQLVLEGIGAPGTANALVLHANVAFRPGTDFTLSNAFMKTTGDFYPRSNAFTRLVDGSTLEVVKFNMDGNAIGTTLELRGRSTLHVTDYSFEVNGGSGTVFVDDSSIAIDNTTREYSSQTAGEGVRCNSAAEGGVNFVFSGAEPSLTLSHLMMNADGYCTFTFVIPAGGFTAPVIRQNAGISTDFIRSIGKLAVRIDRASPALRAKKSTSRLVKWNTGIDTALVDLGGLPSSSGLASFFWTYGAEDSSEPEQESDKPTSLWVDAERIGFMVIIR